jgi:hypothetical protein
MTKGWSWKAASIMLLLSLLPLPAAAGCLLGQGDFDIKVMTLSGTVVPIPEDIQSFLLVNRYSGDAGERVDDVLAGLAGTLRESPYFHVVGSTVGMGGHD